MTGKLCVWGQSARASDEPGSWKQHLGAIGTCRHLHPSWGSLSNRRKDTEAQRTQGHPVHHISLRAGRSGALGGQRSGSVTQSTEGQECAECFFANEGQLLRNPITKCPCSYSANFSVNSNMSIEYPPLLGAARCTTQSSST